MVPSHWVLPWLSFHTFVMIQPLLTSRLSLVRLLVYYISISIRVASPKLVMEEAPESYKNVTDVVNTCHSAGISKKAVKLRPIAVIKG